MGPRTTIYVCVTCRAADEPLEPRSARSGARLFEALVGLEPADLDLAAAECLSVCRRPCTVSFAAQGKWTYVYGDFAPDAAPAVLAAARLYGHTPDGLIPWRRRPDALKKGVVARVPPLSHPVSKGSA